MGNVQLQVRLFDGSYIGFAESLVDNDPLFL